MNPDLKRAATLADVAALAGVSGKTVSRVVNGDANVSVGTREKVSAAIVATGFRPNLAARSLAAARSLLIGCFATSLSSFYYSELYRGAAAGCRRHGYHLVVEEFDHIGGVTAPSQVADRYERDFAQIAYDGLLLPPPIGDEASLLDLLDARGVHYVRIAPATQVARAPSVFADDATGMVALATHLWRLGHRRFGVVTGPPSHAATAIRRDAFVGEIARLGGDAAAIRVIPILPADDLIECGRVAGATLLAAPDRPTAIAAFNDETAAGIIIAARMAGVDVPGDLAVAGFDDSEVARLTWPPLTTVRQPIRAMAETAIDLLVAPRGDTPERRDLAVELVVRASTE